jgi:hypothetical protein
MIYGLSLLCLLLALVFGIPAVREWWRMRRIDRRPGSTLGIVTSSNSAMGWLWAASFGNQDRPRVSYSTPHGEPMVLEIVTSSVLPQRRYEPGTSLLIVYDKDQPGAAYAKSEKGVILREMWVAAGALVLAIAFWVIGEIFNLPF